MTELFGRHVAGTLTLDSYRAMNGVRGAITRRADDLYAELDSEQQAAAKQLFLRLVTIADSDQWGRRRVAASEILSLEVDVVALQGLIELYTAHRLLTLDRDQVTGSPTVEVAHEALLTEWGRLREWIEESRDDVRRHASLSTAMNEWTDADRESDYLLSGTRLDGYEQWAATATMQLTSDERNYLSASIEKRDETEQAGEERLALEAKTARSAKRRLLGLAAAVTGLAAVGIALLIAALAPGPTRVAMLSRTEESGGTGQELMRTGFARAERELDVEAELFTGRYSDIEGEYRDLARTGVDLIFIDSGISGFDWVEDLIAEHPDTAFAVIDPFFGSPNGALSMEFADEQGAYLAGAAAALKTKTGVVGFVSAAQLESLELWRAGYEAGVRSVNPDIEIVATTISTDSLSAFQDVAGAKAAAEQLYQRNADVVLAAAGGASLGVIEAAWEQSQETDIHRWAIGPDSDLWPDVDDHLRPHLLTSATKRVDAGAFEAIQQYTEGRFEPGIIVLTLRDGAYALATSGANLTQADLATISKLSEDIAAGIVTVPRVPDGELSPPPGFEVTHAVSVTWDGDDCHYQGESVVFPAGAAASFDFVNLTSEAATLTVFSFDTNSIQFQAPAKPLSASSGLAVFDSGSYAVNCHPAYGGGLDNRVLGATLMVEESG